MNRQSRAAMVGAAGFALVVGMSPAGALSSPGRSSLGDEADAERLAPISRGDTIAFTRESGCSDYASGECDSTGVYVVNPNGGKVRRLAAGFGPAVSPNGRRIAFTRLRADFMVYLMHADGSHVRQLAAGEDPVWSPDGKRIAFNDYDGITLLDVDTNRIKRLAEGYGPVWSPDGQWIAFNDSKPGSGWYISVIRTDGTQTKELAARASSPVWSPDGRRIAFVHRGKGKQNTIRVINADGSGLRQLTPGSRPVWSPDGRRIAFELSGKGKQDTISVVNADGSGLRQLTRGWGPEWSPDGRRIAFARETDERQGLYVMGADGDRIQELAPARRWEYSSDASWFGAAPTRTTLNASPDPVATGARLMVTGMVTKMRIPLPMARVRIRLRQAGARQFTTVTTLTTGPDGRYRAAFTARRGGTWEAVHPATNITLTSEARVEVRVRR